MSRARKTCSRPGCPNLQPCSDHPRTAWARRPDAPARSIFSGSYQQKRARYVIDRDDGICHVCGYAGANEADHVIPTAEGGADDVSNMRAIHGRDTGRTCHADKTAAEAARARGRA